jgi:hypothetical protein
MSELIQQKKQVTFEQLCPQWTEAIQKGHTFGNLGYMYGCCIVGEAHGFSQCYNWDEEYSCQECRRHATGLVNGMPGASIYVIGSKLRINHKRFEERKEKFMQHWNEHHIGERIG